MSQLLFDTASWDVDTLKRIAEACDEIAVKELRLDCYPNQIEIISSDQMLEAYTSIGMPIMYSHWSFGKQYLRESEMYRRGKMGLAYELVINSDPCINYFMEENTATMQTLVYAHASCVSNDTEYLSPEGWRRMDTYNGGLVAQYNEDGTAEFVQPSNYIKKPQKDFIHVVSTKIDQAITDDHTVVFENGNGNLVKITGKELAERHASKTRGFNGKFINGFNLQTKTRLNMSDDEISLHVAIKADGSVLNPNKDPNHPNSKPYYGVRFHLKKHRKIDRLISILDSLDIIYKIVDTYDGRKSIIFNYPELVDKRFCDKWYSASPEQLKLISEEVLYWDGYKKGGVFTSSNYDDVTYVQYVWASVGYGTHITRGTRCWNVCRTDKNRTSLTDRKQKRSEFNRIPATDAHAYCFTVPSHMFITRRDGKISVTGNCGHNHFFKNNYMFKEWTHADSIIDYLVFAKEYIDECSERYGPKTVEATLDAAHALMSHGVDRYKRPARLSKQREEEKMRKRLAALQADENVIWSTLPSQQQGASPVLDERPKVPSEPQENILWFLEKHSPILHQWQREILRIVRKLAQYFYPQSQTKVMNEGFASSTHYYIMNRLWEKDLISAGNMMEFIDSHAGVLNQTEYDDPRGYQYQGFNPYALGFALFKDIKEKAIARGDDWVECWLDAAANYRDESAIRQFLSDDIIKRWKMFEYDDNSRSAYVTVTGIQNEDHFQSIRETLAESYTLDAMKPSIEVENANVYGDRTLELVYTPYKEYALHESTRDATLRYVEALWGYPVMLRTAGNDSILAISDSGANVNSNHIRI